MAGNKSLNTAAAAKQDEFYTQLSDIEKELRHYRKHFDGKIVLCNCDDPFESNFFKYFVLNFNRLKLKKLIATCYAGSPIIYTQMNFVGDEEEVVQIEREKKPYKVEVTQVYDTTGDGGVDMLDVAELFRMGKNSLELLEGDGDFRSPECLELMDEADIVVTNPPFSLFREYVAILMERKKHFIIIGSENNVTYKEIFPLLRNGNMWLGNCYGDMSFRVPDHYEARETRFWIDENGQKWRSMGNIVWFTNLDIKRRHEPLVLFRKYDPEKYPAHDLSGTLMHISGGVCIGIQCEAGLRVAKDASQCFSIHTGGQGMRGEGVPQIVEADVRQSRLSQQGFELLIGSTGIYRQFWAERVIEDPWGAELALSFAEDLCCTGRQDDLPCSRIGFSVACGERLAFFFVEGAPHMERFLLRIKILPPQCADLAPPQTCGNRGIEEIMPEFILFDGCHESVQLCFGQDFHGSANKFGRVNFCGGIAWDQILLNCRFQGVMQCGVDAVDCSGGKAGGLSISGMYPPGFL